MKDRVPKHLPFTRKIEFLYKALKKLELAKTKGDEQKLQNLDQQPVNLDNFPIVESIYILKYGNGKQLDIEQKDTKQNPEEIELRTINNIQLQNIQEQILENQDQTISLQTTNNIPIDKNRLDERTDKKENFLDDKNKSLSTKSWHKIEQEPEKNILINEMKELEDIKTVGTGSFLDKCVIF